MRIRVEDLEQKVLEDREKDAGIQAWRRIWNLKKKDAEDGWKEDG